MEEPLPIAALDRLIEEVVGIGAVEEPPGHVVDAQRERRLGAVGAERRAGTRNRFVGHLPVDVEAVGVDDHGGDPVLPVAPRDVLGRGLGNRGAEIELVRGVRLLLGGWGVSTRRGSGEALDDGLCEPEQAVDEADHRGPDEATEGAGSLAGSFVRHEARRG